MIYDSFDNLETYKGLSNDIYEALVFLKETDADIENGVHQLNPRVRAIVSEYETLRENPYGYEAHRRFIDIQYVFKGEEKVCYLPITKLVETKAYNPDADVAFFKEDAEAPVELPIGNGFFTILYPQDGHMPQICIKDPIHAKKVIVKIEIV